MSRETLPQMHFDACIFLSLFLLSSLCVGLCHFSVSSDRPANFGEILIRGLPTGDKRINELRVALRHLLRVLGNPDNP